MNGPDKHHMQVLETDDGGHVMCVGCKASGNGFNYRPPGECPAPWLDRRQLLAELAKVEQRNAEAMELLTTWQSWLGFNRASCDEGGQRIWDRIEALKAANPEPSVGP